MLQLAIKDKLQEITGFEVEDTNLIEALDQAFFVEWLNDDTFLSQLNRELQSLDFHYNRETCRLHKI